jgi:acetyl-CoA carboxylase biotin carboxyl carrier protein
MRKNKILELVEIVESHEIEEIEVSRWGSKVRITKSKSNRNGQKGILPSVDKAETDVQELKKEEHPVTIESAETKARKNNEYEIKTPIVGTFYRAPAPDANPYVELGDHVTVNQPLCIIEAMKIMNVIESEVSGKIEEILVENAQPVEYNQTLFIIEKD